LCSRLMLLRILPRKWQPGVHPLFHFNTSLATSNPVLARVRVIIS
jgi:hypothetical protein